MSGISLLHPAATRDVTRLHSVRSRMKILRDWVPRAGSLWGDVGAMGHSKYLGRALADGGEAVAAGEG